VVEAWRAASRPRTSTAPEVRGSRREQAQRRAAPPESKAPSKCHGSAMSAEVAARINSAYARSSAALCHAAAYSACLPVAPAERSAREQRAPRQSAMSVSSLRRAASLLLPAPHRVPPLPARAACVARQSPAPAIAGKQARSHVSLQRVLPPAAPSHTGAKNGTRER